MEVQIEQQATKGTAFLPKEGKRLAEMTFSIAGPHLLIIDHTEVDESLRGQGAGRQLLTATVEKARAEDIKIIPLCPYAKSVFAKEASLRDVLK